MVCLTFLSVAVQSTMDSPSAAWHCHEPLVIDALVWGCLDVCTGKPTSGFAKVELLIPSLQLKDTLCILFIRLQLHLSEDKGCCTTAFKNLWLSFDVTGYHCQSCPFLHFLLPILLLLTPTSLQLIEVTEKMARVTTSTTLILAWKKLLPGQSDSPSHVPHQLLIPTQGTKQDCPFQRQCQLRAFLQLQTDGCSPTPWNSSLVSNTNPAFSLLSCWVTWLNRTSLARLSQEANWPLWVFNCGTRGNRILQNTSISNVLYEISFLSVLKLQEQKKCAKVSFKLLRKQLKQQPHYKISYFYYNKDDL